MRGRVELMSTDTLRANLRLGNCSAYLTDLEAMAAGDVNRFGRMVDSRGKQLGDPESWRRFVVGILTDPIVQEFGNQDRFERCVERAFGLGIVITDQTTEGGRADV